jgi:hypothetical protein
MNKITLSFLNWRFTKVKNVSKWPISKIDNLKIIVTVKAHSKYSGTIWENKYQNNMTTEDIRK